jgi:hypothetical protein
MAAVASSLRRSRKAISPAISSVIVTAVIVMLVTVALTFASNTLLYRIAESEFNSAKQTMVTLGLQIDDVAWIIGRAETVRFSSQYGDVAFRPALNYTVYINTTAETNQRLYSNITGIISFEMATKHHSMGGSYFEMITPSTSMDFLLEGASEPVSRVFVVEKLPMADGSFSRIVAAPSMRMVSTSIGTTDYVRLYLPILLQGETPRRSQSITLNGRSFSTIRKSVTGIAVEVGFPLTDHDNSFFNYPQTVISMQFEEETILELYTGGIEVGFGVHP